MKCIVPLAGPDLISDRYGLRPLVDVGGAPLLKRTIGERAWAVGASSEDYVFVVRDVGGLEPLTSYIAGAWPGARVVKLSTLTGGAMLSALAGAAYSERNQPIVIDLADMMFRGEGCLPKADWDAGVGGIVPCFKADDPAYSYVRRRSGEVVETAEKRVISNEASAGVYAFSDPGTFLAAAAHSMKHYDTLVHGGMLFVCPMMNGVLAQGMRVLAPSAGTVVPIGKNFH